MGFATLMMFIPTVYAVDFGLGLSMVGLVFVLSRSVDLITDPIVGGLSDVMPGRFKDRKLWVCLGVPIFCVGCFLLFAAPFSPGPIQLLCAACLYFIGFTVTDIPLSSIGLEIANSPRERTVLAASKSTFFISGGLIGAAIPTLSNQDVSQTLKVTALLIAALALCFLLFFLYFVPEGSKPKAPVKIRFWPRFITLMGEAYPRWIILIVFLLLIAGAFSGSLSLLYISLVLKAPKMMGPIWFIMGLGTLIGLPLITMLSLRYGRIRIWRYAISGGILCTLPLLVLGEDDIGIMMALSALGGLFYAANLVMPLSLLADFIGGQQASGKSSDAGLITSMRVACGKIASILPMLIAFPLLGAVGIEWQGNNIEASLQISQTAHGVLVGFYALIPIFFRIAALIALSRLEEACLKT